MQETIFHKIISGEIPFHKVYEDEHVLAFLDIHPKNKGHTLVIPKVESREFVWDLDDTTYQTLMQAAKRIALRLRDTLPYQYVHMGIVGIDVPYAHIHLIPFDTTDQLHGGDDDAEPDHAELAQLAEQLRF
ncbi:HIT family protein [Candidatus Saccharibacteria bacterium]|nr:MAG: HIT family protein [Candidatus Saccharibacteria bacterium]